MTINKGDEITIRGQQFVSVGNKVLEGFCPVCNEKFKVGLVAAQRKAVGMRRCEICALPPKPPREKVPMAPALKPGQHIGVHGQVYTFQYSQTYTTKAGRQTNIVLQHFRTNCADCGEEFEVGVSARDLSRKCVTRRCPSHRKPGRPVGVKKLTIPAAAS
jgi:hypothetical protein